MSQTGSSSHALRVPDRGVMLDLLGEQDSHLRVVESAYPAAVIVARGDEIRFHGDEASAQRARRVIKEMLLLVQRGMSLESEGVNRVIEMVNDSVPHPNQVLGESICVARGRVIRPKTVGQLRYLEAIREATLVFGIGPAGTGKTYLAMAAAAEMLLMGEVKRLILTRPAVEAGERLGFLPGDLEAKFNPYLRPLYDALYEMLGPDEVMENQQKGTIEIAPLAYMRGRTLNDSLVVLDEAQNTSRAQMKMFLTRLGFNSKMIITGDATQVDLPRDRRSGLVHAQKLLGKVGGVKVIHLGASDVVRHRLVAEIVEAYGVD